MDLAERSYYSVGINYNFAQQEMLQFYTLTRRNKKDSDLSPPIKITLSQSDEASTHNLSAQGSKGEQCARKLVTKKT